MQTKGALTNYYLRHMHQVCNQVKVSSLKCFYLVFTWKFSLTLSQQRWKKGFMQFFLVCFLPFFHNKKRCWKSWFIMKKSMINASAVAKKTYNCSYFLLQFQSPAHICKCTVEQSRRQTNYFCMQIYFMHNQKSLLSTPQVLVQKFKLI